MIFDKLLAFCSEIRHNIGVVLLNFVEKEVSLMKKFTSGFLAGTAMTLAALAGVAVGFKKVVIEPVEEKEKMVEDNRRRASRKSYSRS